MRSVIENFYKAFEAKDYEMMICCYHDEVVFEDPAFGVLKGRKAKNMWRMLCKSLKEDENSKIVSSNIHIDNNKVRAHWEADYLFSKTKKKIHNVVEAEFEFKDGLIIKHTDTFDLHKWSKQALGFTGVIIGGTSFFKKKLNAQTSHLLTKFEKTL